MNLQSLFWIFFSLLLLCAMLCGCSTDKRYRIGVSQCSEDDWRALLNAEIMREARFQRDMDVEVRSANDDSRQQIEDIDRFVKEGVDLLIVAPNVAADISPAIERAYDQGIPVVLIDRRIDHQKYTAFIGANNIDIGRQIGEYIALAAGDEEALVVELAGLSGSSPEVERHDGFMQALRAHDNIKVAAVANADWLEQRGEEVMDSLLAILPHIDFVYAQNDRMGLGALRAIERAGRLQEMRIVGVDALMSDGGGVDMVVQGKFMATYIYPTGGMEAVLLAKQILTGQAYQREVELPAALVHSQNARVMRLQAESMRLQDENYQELERQTDIQLQKINQQQLMLWACIIIALLLPFASVMLYKYYRERGTNNEMILAQMKTLVEHRQLAQMQALNEEAATHPAPSFEQPAPVLDSAEPLSALTTEVEEAPSALRPADQAFLEQVDKVINSRMADADLSVNDIASELNLSRTQLYRKIKALSDQNVNELIRRARLERARWLLGNSDKSVSEIGYVVGFTSPSYFTKCYKDYFGVSPSQHERSERG